MQYLAKPLIMPVLIFYLLSQTSPDKPALRNWVIAALIYSCAGDILLLFQEKQAIYFLLGLSSFLLAHIFYIVFFQRVKKTEAVPTTFWFGLIVLAYYAVLMWRLTPWLGDMKIPVWVYGIVISYMFFLARHMYNIRNKPAGTLMMSGAFLFILSDSLLAIDKFYVPIASAGIWVMLTYGAAQFFITEGAIKYLRRQ
jgi:uncharacterized membrane protein YhhN